mgnify:CR=1 FL=1
MKKVLLLLAQVLLSFAMFPQSSEQISAILKSEKATVAQVSYLPAVYSSLIQDNDGEAKAFDELKSKGLVPNEVSAEAEATLSDVAYIYTKALGIKGGIFYSLFPSKRYAYKELKARGLFPSNADPSMKVSGRDSIDIFNACLEFAEANGGAE